MLSGTSFNVVVAGMPGMPHLSARNIKRRWVNSRPEASPRLEQQNEFCLWTAEPWELNAGATRLSNGTVEKKTRRAQKIRSACSNRFLHFERRSPKSSMSERSNQYGENPNEGARN